MPTLYESQSVGKTLLADKQRQVSFVIKTSKLCNLRCNYCYEYPELGNSHAISLSQLQAMYTHIADYYYRCAHPVEIEFIWHGGEPLLLGTEYFWKTFDDQTKIFTDDHISFKNLVQTNLLHLDDKLIKLLYEGFDAVGVSIDLFGGLRVNQSGIDSQKRVLDNMDRLRQAGVDFGCICVLNKQNINKASEIYRFFEKAGISFRLLPIFKGATDAQNEVLALSAEEILETLKKFFDFWLNGSNPIIVEPTLLIYGRFASCLYF